MIYSTLNRFFLISQPSAFTGSVPVEDGHGYGFRNNEGDKKYILAGTQTNLKDCSNLDQREKYL